MDVISTINSYVHSKSEILLPAIFSVWNIPTCTAFTEYEYCVLFLNTVLRSLCSAHCFVISVLCCAPILYAVVFVRCSHM